MPPGAAARLSPQEAADGHALYLNKCARCHQFHDPARYSETDWSRWMTKMTRKARLNPDESKLINQFLAAYR